MGIILMAITFPWVSVFANSYPGNKEFTRNPSAYEMTDCELFVDFNLAFNDGGVLKLVDFSPKSINIVMNNYTSMDIDGRVW